MIGSVVLFNGQPAMVNMKDDGELGLLVFGSHGQELVHHLSTGEIEDLPLLIAANPVPADITLNQRDQEALNFNEPEPPSVDSEAEPPFPPTPAASSIEEIVGEEDSEESVEAAVATQEAVSPSSAATVSVDPGKGKGKTVFKKKNGAK